MDFVKVYENDVYEDEKTASELENEFCKDKSSVRCIDDEPTQEQIDKHNFLCDYYKSFVYYPSYQLRQFLKSNQFTEKEKEDIKSILVQRNELKLDNELLYRYEEVV